jgi:hypothetical protein
MHCARLLIVTALTEAGTGLALLIVPSVPLALLLRVDQASPELTTAARIAGAALLALGVACWPVRSDKQCAEKLGLLTGVLIYDVAAAGILAYAGSILGFGSIVLWAAVVVHAALAIWCVACVRDKPRALGRDS